MNVKDKVIIITGASSGIGLASAKLLSKNGAKVVLAARNREKLETLSKEIQDSFVVVADMTKEEDIKNLIQKTKEHFGRIDILINNAGQGYDASLENIDAETFMDVFKLDLLGPVIAMREVIPLMRKQGGGMIINISSGTALMAIPNMSAYSSLKRAIVGFSLTGREELKSDNIKVSVIYPYITLTDFEKNTIREENPEQEWDNDDPDFQPPDSAEYIAEKILEAIETEEAEIFAHDWMKRMRP